MEAKRICRKSFILVKKLLRFVSFISPSPKSSHLAFIDGKAISIFCTIQTVGSSFLNKMFISIVKDNPVLWQKSETEGDSFSATCLILACMPPFRTSQKDKGKLMFFIWTASLNNGAISNGECLDIPHPISVTKKIYSGCCSAYSRKSSICFLRFSMCLEGSA